VKQIIATMLITTLTATTAMATDHWATHGQCGLEDNDTKVVFILHTDSIDTAQRADITGWEWGCDLVSMGATNQSYRYRATCQSEDYEYESFIEVTFNSQNEMFAYEGDFDGAIRTVIRMQPCN